MKTALLLIDTQKEFFNTENPIYQSSQFLQNIKSLLAKARNAKTKVIMVQHCGEKDSAFEKLKPGWELIDELKNNINEHDSVIEKRFCDAFQETDLQKILTQNNIKNIIIAGLQTEYCIDTSCRRAFSLGYNVTLAGDAHSTYNSNGLSAAQIIAHHNMVLGGAFATIKSTQEIY